MTWYPRLTNGGVVVRGQGSGVSDWGCGEAEGRPLPAGGRRVSFWCGWSYLELPRHQEYDQDEQEQSQPSAGVIAPASAIRPSGQHPDQQDDQDHKKEQACGGV